MLVRFSLPLPPSVNDLFANVSPAMAARARRRGRKLRGRVKTKVYDSWCEHAGLMLNAQRVPLIRGDVTVEAILCRPNAQSDLDNRIKGLLDALKGRVITDDRNVVALNVRWGAAPPDTCIVTVASAVVPA
jgi:Holliday junction resolvase RusA-like endonuclease